MAVDPRSHVLVHIPERNFFLVSQIRERLRSLLAGINSIQAVSSSILQKAQQTVAQYGGDREHNTPEHASIAVGVVRCVVSLEELRPDEVSDAVGYEEDGVDGKLLGMT